MTRGSVEVEFILVVHGIYEALWIRRLLEELKIPNTSPMKVYCDNKGTIAIAHNLVLNDKSKHVKVNKNFIKEKLEKGLIRMSYILVVEQIADVLIKGQHKRQFDYLIGKLTMEGILKLLEGECWKHKNPTKI